MSAVVRARCPLCHRADRWAAQWTEILITPHSVTWWAWCPTCNETFSLPVPEGHVDDLVAEGCVVLDWSTLRPDTPPRRLTRADAELLERVDRMPRRMLRRILAQAAEQILGVR